MLYDLGTKPPPGSLLESVFKIMSQRRMLQELLRTKVLMEATLAPHAEEGAKSLQKTMDRYMEAMMPHLKKVGVKTSESEKEVLDRWTNRGPLGVRPLSTRPRGGNSRKITSALAKGRQRVQQLEADRKAGRLKPIG